MSDSRHRLSIKRIQVHAKSDLEGHGAHPTVTTVLKAGDTVLGQKDNCTWGDLDWELQPPAQIDAADTVCLEITHGLATPHAEHWVLATTTFADPASLDGAPVEGRAPVQLEHALATIEIHFTAHGDSRSREELVAPGCPPLCPHPESLLGFDASSGAGPVAASPLATGVPSSADLPRGRGLFQDPQHDELICGGSVSYAMVGTPREGPKKPPRHTPTHQPMPEPEGTRQWPKFRRALSRISMFGRTVVGWVKGR